MVAVGVDVAIEVDVAIGVDVAIAVGIRGDLEGRGAGGAIGVAVGVAVGGAVGVAVGVAVGGGAATILITRAALNGIIQIEVPSCTPPENAPGPLVKPVGHVLYPVMLPSLGLILIT
jgi:hypothetical protein